MSQPLLSFDDLIRGLDAFPAYQALDVFANSVEEIRTHSTVAGLSKIDDRKYQLVRDGRTFVVEVLPEKNVLRFRRRPDAGVPAPAVAAGTGAAIAAALADDSLLGALAGGLFGLLVGKAVSGNASAGTRVFTLRFDPEHKHWLAYDGGLVPWVKEQLLSGLDLLGATNQG